MVIAPTADGWIGEEVTTFAVTFAAVTLAA